LAQISFKKPTGNLPELGSKKREQGGDPTPFRKRRAGWRKKQREYTRFPEESSFITRGRKTKSKMKKGRPEESGKAACRKDCPFGLGVGGRESKHKEGGDTRVGKKNV